MRVWPRCRGARYQHSTAARPSPLTLVDALTDIYEVVVVLDRPRRHGFGLAAVCRTSRAGWCSSRRDAVPTMNSSRPPTRDARALGFDVVADHRRATAAVRSGLTLVCAALCRHPRHVRGAVRCHA